MNHKKETYRLDNSIKSIISYYRTSIFHLRWKGMGKVKSYMWMQLEKNEPWPEDFFDFWGWLYINNPRPRSIACQYISQ